MDPKCGQPSGQFDVFHFWIDFAGSLKFFVLAENFLFDLVGSDVRLRQKLFEAAKKVGTSDDWTLLQYKTPFF